jgi:hypothetical protein
VVRTAISSVIVVGLAAAVAGTSAGAPGRSVKQTFAFDLIGKGSFVDKPPSGPSPGDIELATGKLVDASGHVVGSATSRCVFTKAIPGDMLESCRDSAKTGDGTVSISGIGHLHSMNPPWRLDGMTGAYRGVHGTQIYSTDIPLDPNVPVAPGRFFSVSVIEAKVTHPLKVGVVPRPAANAGFIRRADAACSATERKVQSMGDFPFPDFDPFHPDPQTLPQVGQFFNQPARRALPSGLLTKLEKLGKPPASRSAWQRVLAARRTIIGNETKQTNAALANDAPTFVASVYQMSRDYNRLVFASAIFGVQSCTFG